MSGERPPVSVVMPFAGEAEQRRAALAVLCALRVRPGDQLILADNCGGRGPEAAPSAGAAAVEFVAATGERSPAHARNAGAAHARNDWILFLDADTLAPADLLDRYFESSIGAGVGLLAGEIRPAPGAPTLARRYAAQRNFLSQRAHLEHPFLPRASAANMLVRRLALEQVGGFTEGIGTAEDTDLCWRLQRAGWLIELRPAAVVEHRYRERLGDLRRQWRAYAAGRAWLARRYPEFHPSSAAARARRRLARALLARAARLARVGAVGRGGLRAGGGTAHPPAAAVDAASAKGPGGADSVPQTARERLAFAAVDCLLGVEELIGMRLENRPDRASARLRAPGCCPIRARRSARGR